MRQVPAPGAGQRAGAGRGPTSVRWPVPVSLRASLASPPLISLSQAPSISPCLPV